MTSFISFISIIFCCLCVVFKGETFCHCDDYESLTLTGAKLQATEKLKELHAWLVGQDQTSFKLEVNYNSIIYIYMYN